MCMKSVLFERYNPIVPTLYYISVVLIVSLNLHPFTLIASLVGAVCCGVLACRKDILKYAIGGIPFVLIVAIINVATNHRGETILFYLNSNPITLQSIVYGLVLGTLYLTIILWCLSMSRVLTSDRLLVVTGYFSPEVSLVISMAMRFIPKYKAKLNEIFYAQKCMGNGLDTANILKKVTISVNCISILITWALENALETADSMKCRGFGSNPYRTAYHPIRFKRLDVILLVAIVLLDVVIISTYSSVKYSYDTHIYVSMNPKVYIFTIAYGILCILPTILTIKEFQKW